MSFHKGMVLECQLSLSFHSRGIPILVDPVVLRSRGCGQLDMAKLDEKRLKLLEVKTSLTLTKKQRRRLMKSADFLGELFSCSASLDFASSQKEHLI